ncbi:MAG: hypothetical protein C1941_08790 [Prosthecochloris sp.]|nr:hypothetical protein [Prosthecochloris sp.]
MQEDDTNTMVNLVQKLRQPSAYPHPVEKIEVVETHISLVFLTGTYAYKIKKAVNLGFLDFSSLENREHFCREELRLNRRLCKELYLDVLPVTIQGESVMIGGKGSIIDFVVKMLQFDRTKEVDTLLASNRITGDHIDRISQIVSAFHESAPAAGPDSAYGRAEILIKPIRDNFTEAERLKSQLQEKVLLKRLKQWTENEYSRLMPLFAERKANGAVRECHGDMHTGNMVLWKKNVMIFDCIEFNPLLSTIDVMSEIAFLIMDLEHSGHPEYAWRFLNNYLSLTGDYEGLPLLRFYKTYRAMVRAKVTAIRHLQEENREEKEKTLAEHYSYISTALTCSSPAHPGLILTCGVSGSGKTSVAREIASHIPTIHIRSDIERKRLFGLKQFDRSGRDLGREMYSEKSSSRTYTRLFEIASTCLMNGYTVIVDATFLRREERERFMALSRKAQCPVIILNCTAPVKLLEKRVTTRNQSGGDASEADRSVLMEQLRNLRSFSTEEQRVTITIDTSTSASTASGITETISRIQQGSP